MMLSPRAVMTMLMVLMAVAGCVAPPLPHFVMPQTNTIATR
jgi:hypothetical protein